MKQFNTQLTKTQPQFAAASDLQILSNFCKDPMNSTNYFPLDINASKKYGIKKWQEEFFWPVSYKSFLEVEARIKETLNELINENRDNYLGDLLVINYKIFFEYTNLLHALWVLKDLREKGLKPLYGEDSVIYKGILEKGIPLSKAIPSHFPPVGNVISKLKSQARLIKGTLLFNKTIATLLKSLFRITPFIADQSYLNHLACEYINDNVKNGIRLRNLQDWYKINPTVNITESQKEEIQTLSNKIVQKVREIAESYSLQLTELQSTYLTDITLDLFLKTFIFLNSLKIHISRLKPMNLFIGCSGNLFLRMISIAVRDNGGMVTGFIHGEPVIYKWDKYSWLELSTVDRFITYTERSAKTMASLLETYPPLKKNTVKIEGAETRSFYDIWQRESKKPIPKRIERVMVIASYYSDENKLGQGIAFPELMQLDWELRIIDILKKAGYKVIYKKHPEVPSSKIHGLPVDSFDGTVKSINDSFEDVMDYADAYVFYFTRSTPLCHALCTNKPLIYINGGWEEWIPEMYVPFSKRCRIVSSYFDERNRLIINEEGLLNALACKPAEPNTEFIEKYMFPNNSSCEIS